MDPSAVRVLIVDDHAQVRWAMAVYIAAEEDMTVVGEASDGLEALSSCERARPDVVLMDLKMPGMDGIEATRNIISRFPGVAVIVLTNYDEPEHRNAALQAGAVDFFAKNTLLERLPPAIRAACRPAGL